MFGFGKSIVSGFVGAFKLFEFVGNTIGGAISDIVSMLLQAASDTAALIPGFGDTSKGLKSAADYMANQADAYLKAANSNLAASGRAFSDAFSGQAPAIGQAIASGAVGPMTGFVRQAREAARAAAVAPDQSPGPQKKPVAAVVRISSEDLKAIVAGSAEAESFRNSLMRGADPRLDTTDEQRRTADATERTADGIREIARTGLIGLATIA